ncbi:MAG: 4-hydroxythreonine-4-phosphate dehydrogenase PdxA, partial [Planctomycetes bacterium]|nr:4-hydroxythreonine-4-phosphate dehydrogenase PdxA [Planctomycetota bacterium]
LPIVRTSVDHGTAYDIAGSNQADAGSMKAAISLAVDLAAGNRRRTWPQRERLQVPPHPTKSPGCAGDRAD